MKSTSSALAFMLWLTACNEAAAPSMDAIDVEPPDLPRWTAVEDLRIAGVGAGDASLAGATLVEAGADGRIYVGKWREGRISVFDGRGAYVRSFGQAEDGPGESVGLRAGVFNMGWLGDTLYVAELAGPRILFYSADGGLLSWTDVEGAVAPGTLYATGRAAPLGLALGTALSGDSLRQPVLEVSRDGRTVDTLGWVAYPYPLARGTRDGRPWSVAAPQPYRDHDLTFQTGDGQSYFDVTRPAARSAGSALFSVRKRNRADSTLWERSYRYDPVPVRASAVDSAVAATVASAPAGVPRDGLAQQLRALVHVPPYEPPVRQMRVNPDGSFWLLRERAEGVERWGLFDAEGQPVAMLDLPEGETPALFRGQSVYSWRSVPGRGLELVRYRVGR